MQGFILVCEHSEQCVLSSEFGCQPSLRLNQLNQSFIDGAQSPDCKDVIYFCHANHCYSTPNNFVVKTHCRSLHTSIQQMSLFIILAICHSDTACFMHPQTLDEMRNISSSLTPEDEGDSHICTESMIETI